MNVSDVLWEFHKIFEGYEPRAYRDSVGVLTIGVGHANQDTAPFSEGDEWDDEHIHEVWLLDVQRAEELANGWIHRDVPQPFFDTAVDIIFNVGRRPTTFINNLNAGDLEAAAYQILRWVYAGGRVELGLVRRRFAAYAMCLQDNWYDVAMTPLSSKNLDPFNAMIARYGFAIERVEGPARFEIVEV